MTLALGYLGNGFAAIVTDTLDFVGGPAQIPRCGANKFCVSGDRLVYVISGKVPSQPPPDVSNDHLVIAVRNLRDWVLPVNSRSFNSELGTAFYLMVAGGPTGRPPGLSVIESLGGPRHAAVGDLFVIGGEAVISRGRGIERNYGELSQTQAKQLLLETAEDIVSFAYADLGAPGCRTPEEFNARVGVYPGIGRPFRLAFIDPNNPITFTET